MTGRAAAAPPNWPAIRMNAAVVTYFRAYQLATDLGLEFDRCAPRAIWRGPSRLQTTHEAAHSAIFGELLP